MAQPATPSAQIVDGREVLATEAQQCAVADRYTGPASTSAPGRSVLSGALAVLDAVASADDGLGLTALARASGLAKPTAYRLAEQLADLQALQRVCARYYIGARLERIGQRWQPHPVLRKVAQGPVHTLAIQTGAMATVRMLHENTLRTVCATVRRGQAWLPNPTDAESLGRTATGRVLYATQPVTDMALPDCWTSREWQRLRGSIRDVHAVVVDQQEAFPGVCCVSAPVWWPNGTSRAAVTAVVQAPKPTPSLRHLVVQAARRIGAGLTWELSVGGDWTVRGTR